MMMRYLLRLKKRHLAAHQLSTGKSKTTCANAVVPLFLCPPVVFDLRGSCASLQASCVALFVGLSGDASCAPHGAGSPREGGSARSFRYPSILGDGVLLDLLPAVCLLCGVAAPPSRRWQPYEGIPEVPRQRPCGVEGPRVPCVLPGSVFLKAVA